jgi:integrase
MAIPKSLIPFIALGAFAGLRAAELQRLDWSEIDLARGYVTVAASKAKTRKRRLVPISDNLRLWLEPHRQESGPISLLDKPQVVARKYCYGFKWAKNGLRHSYISYRLAVIHDTGRVALEAGNSPEIIFGHYRELVTPEAATDWFSIKPE